MSEKPKFYIGKLDYDNIVNKPAMKMRQSILITNFREDESDIEIEIKEIVPVYEYKLLLRSKEHGTFYLSLNYYKDLEECEINTRYEVVKIIEETKRIRK